MALYVVALRDAQLGKQICESIKQDEELTGAGGRVDRRSSVTGVQMALEDADEIAAIVIDYDLGDVSDADDGAGVVDLLESFEALPNGGPPVILLGEVDNDADADRLSRLVKVRPLDTVKANESDDPDDPGSPPRIVVLLRRLVRPNTRETVGEMPVHGWVTTVIEPDYGTARWETTCYVDGPRKREDGRFKLERRTYQQLDIATRTMREALTDDTFMMQYRVAGWAIRDLLRRDPDFNRAVHRLIHETGGIDKVWFRFAMEAANVPSIPFESVLQYDGHEDMDDEFQLALSPVYRVVDNDWPRRIGYRAPLMSCYGSVAQPINCLVINAATQGMPQRLRGEEIPDLQGGLASMPSAKEECDAVHDILAACRQRGVVGHLDYIDLTEQAAEAADDRDGTAVLERLKETLAERTWHLVHFCGHSHVPSGTGKVRTAPASRNDVPTRGDAYVFLPAGRFPRPVDIIDFSDWLDKTDFIYLSSCQSAGPGFIHALAKKGIPTIVGFRWKVRDFDARAFAEKFYQRLCGQERLGRIEMAFAETQRDFKQAMDAPDSTQAPPVNQSIWANTMLVMQNVVG